MDRIVCVMSHRKDGNVVRYDVEIPLEKVLTVNGPVAHFVFGGMSVKCKVRPTGSIIFQSKDVDRLVVTLLTGTRRVAFSRNASGQGVVIFTRNDLRKARREGAVTIWLTQR